MVVHMSYAVLHAHDTYGSIGDSILYIKDYVRKAKELGISSIAITNHGSLSTIVEFYDTCKENGIKPIIGCEFYYVENYAVKEKGEKRCHLILLAKNDIGIRNLIHLHNIATEEGVYYKPRIDFSLLETYHKGLICLTACIAGHIPRLILRDDFLAAKDEILKFKSLFGADFYLELQPGNFAEQKKVNRWLYQLSQEYDTPYVVTNDVHYLNKDEWQIHDYHVKDARKQSLEDPQVYPDRVYYLMAREELKQALAQTMESDGEKIAETALQNTLLLADKVDASLPSETLMPCYDATINEANRLERLCWQRLRDIQNRIDDPAVYASRLEHELDVIHTLQFDGYFLIIKDIIDFCDANHIARGPGRGSAVGSLVSYLLNISKVDPIQYGLLFERFLSKERVGFPDIDIDVISEKRNLIYQHIIQRYGSDHCCFVSTFNKRKARAAIKTAARILNFSAETGDMLSKAIPYVIYDEEEKQVDPSIEEVIEKNPSIASMAKRYPDIFQLAIQLQGYPSSMGIHPAGIVISPVSIIDRYPLIRAKDKELHATSLDLKDVERLSGVKIDLLALSNLTVISAVEEQTNDYVNYETPGFFDDDTVWNLIGSNQTTGLFQISSPLYRSRMPRLRPRSIPELANCLALVRGPCISSGADRKYIRILYGQEEPDPICPEYWKYTQHTCGIIIYQEQVLQIGQEIGLQKEDSYRLLKACSKKKADKIKEYESLFFQCGRQKNIEEDNLQRIWDEILNSAKYAFNISHATAYAYLCYASAWLKIHHASEYMCELLNKAYLKPDITNIQLIINDCKKLGLTFQPLNVNTSAWNFTLDESGSITVGFTALKGLGEKAYGAIMEARPFSTLKDFLSKVPGRQCNKKCVTLLILANAFEGIEHKQAIAVLEEYVKEIRKEESVSEIKLGKETIFPSDSRFRIEQKLFGTYFNRKGEAA